MLREQPRPRASANLDAILVRRRRRRRADLAEDAAGGGVDEWSAESDHAQDWDDWDDPEEQGDEEDPWPGSTSFSKWRMGISMRTNFQPCLFADFEKTGPAVARHGKHPCHMFLFIGDGERFCACART